MMDAHGSFSYGIHSAIWSQVQYLSQIRELARFSALVMAGEFLWLHPFSADLELVLFYTLGYLCLIMGFNRSVVDSSCPCSHPGLSVDILAWNDVNFSYLHMTK